MLEIPGCIHEGPPLSLSGLVGLGFRDGRFRV